MNTRAIDLRLLVIEREGKGNKWVVGKGGVPVNAFVESPYALCEIWEGEDIG